MLVCQLSPHSLYVTREKDSPSGKGVYNPVVTKPTIIYHADWGSKPSKRWCAKAKRKPVPCSGHSVPRPSAMPL